MMPYREHRSYALTMRGRFLRRVVRRRQPVARSAGLWSKGGGGGPVLVTCPMAGASSQISMVSSIS